MYYKFYFYDVYYDLDVDNLRVKQEYVVYDLMLFMIKKCIDVVFVLLKEISEIVISLDKLKFRECKVLV